MLINCHECGVSMSDTAAKCPHCGAPKPMSQDDKALKVFILFITGLVIYYIWRV
jgi:uncharacterized paraquat-inducible protein A